MLDHKPNPENIGKHAYDLIWSGHFMPMIGDTVNAGSFGSSIVISYFTEDGYLGVEVEPIKPPQWWINLNNGKNKNAFMFGIEINEVTK